MLRGFEVLKLTPHDFAERELHESPLLTPGGSGWRAVGMHTLDPHEWENGSWIGAVDGLGFLNGCVKGSQRMGGSAP
jgi:hypothetical protein